MKEKSCPGTTEIMKTPFIEESISDLKNASHLVIGTQPLDSLRR